MHVCMYVWTYGCMDGWIWMVVLSVVVFQVSVKVCKKHFGCQDALARPVDFCTLQAHFLVIYLPLSNETNLRFCFYKWHCHNWKYGISLAACSFRQSLGQIQSWQSDHPASLSLLSGFVIAKWLQNVCWPLWVLLSLGKFMTDLKQLGRNWHKRQSTSSMERMMPLDLCFVFLIS